MKNNFNIAFIRFALLLVTLFQSLNVVKAQTYPVQVNVNTAGPYYNYLSYYADENFHLQAVVTLTDFNSAPVQARLRLKIEGPGYTAITKPGVVVGSTFTLSPGMPEFVKGIDLAPYFYENNLLVTPSGINLNNLPEGFTTICVEVINDSPAQEVLSTNNCTSFFLQRFQPSQLVFPACGSSVNPSEQFHTFQWTPPVGFVPSIGTEINYTFSLYEWNDPSNYNIFQTGQGLVYTTQTSNPLVQLSSFDITFQEGLTYVWRIEAQILSNGLEVNMLENNGISSPCTFVYGQVQSLEESLADGLTIDLNTSSEGERKGRAYWTVIDNTPGEGLSTFSSFVVAYRKQPTGNEEFDLTWFEDTVSSFSQFIYQLEPSTTYEVKIAGIAGDFVSDYSEVETFTTNAPRNYACGDQDLPFRPANYTPLENALVGMIFQIGQFDMTITQITPTGSAGHYSGKGMIPVAFLGGARAKVQFDDILVDDQYLVREGQVDVVTKGVENWLSEEYLSMVDPIDVQGQITAYGFANDSTVWAVVNGDTLTWTFQNDLPIVIHGEGNVEIQYWPDGHIVVTTYGSIPSTDSLSATASLNIQFEEVVGQESYFDKKEHDHFAENYEAISCAGNYVYWVPNASRRKTESRQVKAVFHGYDEILDVSKVKFEMNGGYTIAQHTVLNDSTYLVTLPIKDFDYQLYAKYDTLKMGKLNVKSFAQVTKNIKIVPLVPLNYSSTDVSQSLTNLYQGAHVNCVVSIDSLFNTSEFNSSTVFANPEVNGMLHYTEQMRNLREAYFLNHELENDTYLIFVINGFEDASVDGYMVRGKGLGFVTQSSLTTLETFTHTLGHELGHGIGGLEHAWGDAVSKKNTTDNLMDYSGGTTLTNNQWQALHNSENVFSLLDSEEDGSSVTISLSFLLPLANDNSFTFIDITGNTFSIPKNSNFVRFSTLDRLIELESGDESNIVAPVGSVLSFSLNDTLYSFSGNGYYKVDETGYPIISQSTKYVDNLSSIDLPTKAITTFFAPDGNELKLAYFHVDINKLESISNRKFIVFDDASIDISVSLSSFLAHHKSDDSPLLTFDHSVNNFGANTNPISIYYPDQDTTLYITPFTVFNSSLSSFSPDYLVKYLILCNYKKNDFQFYADCLKEEMIITLTPFQFNDIVVGCTTCVDLNSINVSEFDNFKYELTNHFSQAIEKAIGLSDPNQFNDFVPIVNDGSLEEIKTWINAQRLCVLSFMPSNLRAKAFCRLMENDSYWVDALILLKWFSEEDLLAMNQFVDLLSSNTYGNWLSNSYPQLNETWEPDGSDFHNLRSIFMEFTKLYNFIPNNSNFANTIYNKSIYLTNSISETPIAYSYSALDVPIYFSKNSNNYLGPSHDQISYEFFNFINDDAVSIEFLNGKVVVKQNYNAFNSSVSYSAPGAITKKINYSILYELNPYELVTVQFLDNYALELGFDQGENIVVPAYYLILYKKAIAHSNWYSNFRLVTDVATIGAAVFSSPFTLCGSLAILTGLIAAKDIDLTYDKQNASSEELKAIQDWETFYTVSMLLTATPQLYKVLGSVTSSGLIIRSQLALQNGWTKIQALPNTVKQSLVAIKNFFLGVSGAGKLVDNLNLGNFVKKVGQYDVYQNGEVFYRAMNQADFDHLIAIGEIRVPLDRPNSEMFTSPTLSYIENSAYLEGTIIVKFQMKPGTINKLKEIGTVKVSDVGNPLISDFGNLSVNQSGWMQNNTLFKIEHGQVNIGLGRNGEGMNRFNNNILHFQRTN